ncbi:hypothetical protein R1flu_000934 [Riccia fluitans]|uniref:Uncharacterized protein n=1 Tax=Riccia fluitans TaxID=41844 RepID=A0ABD1Y1V0_9MARC
MSRYNDFFGDDDAPAWLTASREEDDQGVAPLAVVTLTSVILEPICEGMYTADRYAASQIFTAKNRG